MREINDQHMSCGVPLVKNLNYYNGDVRADAAAAIAIVFRENYKSYMYTGGAGDPEANIFEMGCQTAEPNFPIFRDLGMVGWQNAHGDKQKQKYNQKTRFSAFSAAAA